jgi:glycosyltransferase involved in cell wall biosynthesis
MKVLFTIDTLMGGGTEKSTLELIRHFSKDMDVTLCYFYPKHDLRDDFVQSPCKLIFLDLPGKYSFIKGIFRLSRLIKQNNFDLVVTSLYRASVISRIVCFFLSVPLVDTIVNESYGMAKKREFKGVHIIKYYLVYLLDRMTSFIPRLWISNAETIGSIMSNKLFINPKKIKTIYRGRPVHEMQAWSRPEAALFQFTAIGRLYTQKAHADLIRAFHKFYQSYPKSSLTIYGEGPLRESLNKLIEELSLKDIVKLAGRVPDAWKRLHDAHCFMLPSHYEGFSGALIEALIIGIPVICSDIPMNVEAVEDGVNGMLFTCGDVGDLYQKMVLMYNDYDTAMKRGERAREIALSRYDIIKTSAAYEQLICSVVA